MLQEIVTIKSTLVEAFKEARDLVKAQSPQSREQRQKHSEIHQKLLKTERKFTKLLSSVEAHSEQEKNIGNSVETCKEIVQDFDEQDIA